MMDELGTSYSPASSSSGPQQLHAVLLPNKGDESGGGAGRAGGGGGGGGEQQRGPLREYAEAAAGESAASSASSSSSSSHGDDAACRATFTQAAFAVDVLVVVQAIFCATFVQWILAAHGHYMASCSVRMVTYAVMEARMATFVALRMSSFTASAVVGRSDIMSHRHLANEFAICGAVFIGAMSEFAMTFGFRVIAVPLGTAAVAVLFFYRTGVYPTEGGRKATRGQKNGGPSTSASYAHSEVAKERYAAAGSEVRARGWLSNIAHAATFAAFACLTMFVGTGFGLAGVAFGAAVSFMSSRVSLGHIVTAPRAMLDDGSAFGGDVALKAFAVGGRTAYAVGCAASSLALLASMVLTRGAERAPTSDPVCSSLAFAGWLVVSLMVPECGYLVPVHRFAQNARLHAEWLWKKFVGLFEVSDLDLP